MTTAMMDAGAATTVALLTSALLAEWPQKIHQKAYRDAQAINANVARRTAVPVLSGRTFTI